MLRFLEAVSIVSAPLAVLWLDLLQASRDNNAIEMNNFDLNRLVVAPGRRSWVCHVNHDTMSQPSPRS